VWLPRKAGTKSRNANGYELGEDERIGGIFEKGPHQYMQVGLRRESSGAQGRVRRALRRRLRPDGPWSDAGMAIESEITVSSQHRGKEFEYRVIAVNPPRRTGEGEPSNTVMAVL